MMKELKYNRVLTVSLIIGVMGYSVSAVITGLFVDYYIGTTARKAYTTGLATVSLFGIAAVICSLIAIFKPKKFLTYIACAINMLCALIILVTPASFAHMFTDLPEVIAGLVYLKMSAVIILALSVVSVVIGRVFRSLKLKAYIVISAAAAVVSGLLSFMMIAGRYGFPAMGLSGAGFSNLAQPIAAVLPLLLFNNEKHCVVIRKTKTGASNAKYEYLEEYKKRNKD